MFLITAIQLNVIETHTQLSRVPASQSNLYKWLWFCGNLFIRLIAVSTGTMADGVDDSPAALTAYQINLQIEFGMKSIITADVSVLDSTCIIVVDHLCYSCPPDLPLLRRIDLILILWPIFFVAATRQDPHLKPRDFKRSAETVAGVTGFTGVTASIAGPLKRSIARDDKGGRQIDVDATDHQLERPYWEDSPPQTDRVEQLVSALKRSEFTLVGSERHRVLFILETIVTSHP